MGTKEYLGQISRYDCMMANKICEIRKLLSDIYGISSSQGSERVQTSGVKDAVGDSVSRLVDLQSEVDELSKKRCKIIAQIEQLPDAIMYDVLAKRFVLDKTFDEIGADIRKSSRQTYRIYNMAIKRFEKEFGSTYLNK